MIRWLVGLVMVVALVGCGAASDSSMHCASDMRRGSCTITYDYLEDTVASREIRDDDWRQANAVEVLCRLTVESGTVRVWFEDSSGVVREVIVAPGDPVVLAGTARLEMVNDKRVVTLYFEPLGENGAKRAENLVAVVDYDIP